MNSSCSSAAVFLAFSVLHFILARNRLETGSAESQYAGSHIGLLINNAKFRFKSVIVLFQLLPPSHYNIPHSAWCAIATPIKPLIIFCPFCLCCNSGVHQIASEYGVHIGHGSAVEAIIDQVWSHFFLKILLCICFFVLSWL